MTQTLTREQRRTDSTRRTVAALLAVLAAAAVTTVWWFFVTTATGQHLDDVAYTGSRIGRTRLAEYTQSVLDVVSVPFLIVVIVVATAVALLRRRWWLALGVGAVVGAANLTTQLLKYEVFNRPDLGITDGYAANTLPSGHTTVAGSVGLAVLLVAPARWRWLVAPLAAVYTGATGIATMADGWHRASDVVAAVLVVTGWALLAVAVTGPVDAVGPVRAAGWVLGVAGVAGALVALVCLLLTRGADADPSRAQMLIAYGGASVGVMAVLSLATLAVLLVGARPAR
ncbi:phosphatase PAP2 family protein [Georgenia yuyongxinii]|uniref:phosphatase PAP2 family protein n=1 Tax=Georgenia yuyongxinii TaxID=2589797 RepID=UPI00143CE7DC|nr:phosphatase PAP2 family protein [Georgenia yuyongxinii]